MAAPTPDVWAAVKKRDEFRCASCSAESPLSFQHRQAVGMGGTKRRPTAVQGVTACMPCNGRFEGDLQLVALVRGWKVRRYANVLEVPVFYRGEGWFALVGESRLRISDATARERMLRAYGPVYEEWEAKVAA